MDVPQTIPEKQIEQFQKTIKEQQKRIFQEIAERGALHHHFLTILEQQEAILSSIPALIYIKDTNNSIITANERFLTAFNIASKALPVDIETELSSLDLKSLLKDDKSIMENNRSIILDERFIIPHAGGSSAWYWVSKIPFHSANQEVLGMVGSIVDISDLKTTQIALQQSEQLFRTLAERSFSAIFISQNTIIKYINPLFKSSFSIPADKQLNAIDLLSFFSSDDAEKLKNKCHAIENEGLHSSRFLLSAIPQNNTNTYIFEAYLTQIDFHNKPAVLGCLLDITDKYLAGLALEEKAKEHETLNLQLEQRIQQELQKRKQDEDLLLHQSRLAAMGEMIGAIAHQWRQPLTTLSIMIQNLMNTYHFSGIDETTIKRFVEDSRLNITRMTEGIDQFSQFFTVTDNDPPPMTISTLIQDSVFIFSRSYPERHIDINLTPELNVKIWHGQTNAFKQVIISLLSLVRAASSQHDPAKHAITLTAVIKKNQLLIQLLLPIDSSFLKDRTQPRHHLVTLEMCKKLVVEHMQGKFRMKSLKGSTLEFFIELSLK